MKVFNLLVSLMRLEKNFESLELESVRSFVNAFELHVLELTDIS